MCAEALQLGTLTETPAAPAVVVALWLSLLPWLDDPRWLAKGDPSQRQGGTYAGSAAPGIAPGMEPIEELLEALQEHVLRLYGGELAEAASGSAFSVSGSSAAGGFSSSMAAVYPCWAMADDSMVCAGGAGG